MKLTVTCVIATACAATAFTAEAEVIYGLTAGNSLVRFDSSTPGTSSTMLIGGLAAGEALRGIDFRPATGELVGLGSSNRLYTIELLTGVATLAGSGPDNDPFGPPALSGTSFGVDFNPAVDRLRVVGNTGQNLRLNPITGALVTADAAINPPASIVGAAYDRNDLDPATPTTLFVIDSASDQLFLQGSVDGAPVSPNSGTLAAVGALGVDTSEFVGFDISTQTGFAYASLTAPGSFSSGFYRIDLSTGAASLVGGTGLLLDGIAVAPVPVPAAGWLMLGGVASLAWRRRRTLV